MKPVLYPYPQYKIFGTDIDIPIRTFRKEQWADITDVLKALAHYIPSAEKVEALVIGEIETAPAYRIRIRGFIKTENIPNLEEK